MSGRDFSLKPFHPAGSMPDLKITGSITRRSGTLAVRYTLLGPLMEIMVTAPADRPVRKKKLWEETCFEFFLGIKDSERYWEINLSPEGHWNVYSFKSYRHGMQEEPAFMSLPFSVRDRSDTLQLALEFELSKIIPDYQPLQAGISAVIKTTDNKKSYWALTHPGPRADFHLRDSFILEL